MKDLTPRFSHVLGIRDALRQCEIPLFGIDEEAIFVEKYVQVFHGVRIYALVLWAGMLMSTQPVDSGPLARQVDQSKTIVE
ncbi:MAG: hypothetical protein ACYCZR_05310 [Burkholderiales bacterium]